MEATFAPTSRGGLKICLGGHIYRYQKSLAGDLSLSLGGNATALIAISDAPDSQLPEEWAQVATLLTSAPMGRTASPVIRERTHRQSATL